MPPPSSIPVSGNPDLYSGVVRDALMQNKDFAEAYELAKNVTKGKRYVVGSFVYKTVINTIYGTNAVINDIDFLADQVIPDTCHSDWKRNGSKFTKPGTHVHNCTKRCRRDYTGIVHDRENDSRLPGKQVDMIPLQRICRSEGHEPSLENYLTGVPFTIQSIAYDLEKNLLIGDIGINAIRSRTVGVQNIVAAQRYTNLPKHDTSLRHPAGHPLDAPERVTVKDLLERKARELDFTPLSGRCLCSACILHARVSSTISNMLK